MPLNQRRVFCCVWRPREPALLRVVPCVLFSRRLVCRVLPANRIGSPNPHTLVRATFEALQSIASPRSVAQKRHKRVSEIFATSKGAYPAPVAEKSKKAAEAYH